MTAVYPAADVQTEFKGADLVFLCICKDRFPGNPLLFLYDLINSVIDPVKMSLCPWAGNWIAVRFFQDTQLSFAVMVTVLKYRFSRSLNNSNVSSATLLVIVLAVR